MKIYADTNFFTRLYLQLGDTPAALALLDKSERKTFGSIPITWLLRLELTNAIQFHVFAGRSGQIRVTPEQAAIATATFHQDLLDDDLFCKTPVSMEELEKSFTELSLRHTAKHGFRTYDLLHVASALMLECDTFWSFDPKANKLAKLEGLRIRS